jgi:hypothetical protein
MDDHSRTRSQALLQTFVVTRLGTGAERSWLRPRRRGISTSVGLSLVVSRWRSSLRLIVSLSKGPTFEDVVAMFSRALLRQAGAKLAMQNAAAGIHAQQKSL